MLTVGARGAAGTVRAARDVDAPGEAAAVRVTTPRAGRRVAGGDQAATGATCCRSTRRRDAAARAREAATVRRARARVVERARARQARRAEPARGARAALRAARRVVEARATFSRRVAAARARHRGARTRWPTGRGGDDAEQKAEDQRRNGAEHACALATLHGALSRHARHPVERHGESRCRSGLEKKMDGENEVPAARRCFSAQERLTGTFPTSCCRCAGRYRSRRRRHSRHRQ